MRLELPKAKIAEEKPAPKGRAKKLEGTEEEDVASAPVDALVEIVHEENKGPFAPSQEAESSEQAPVTARAHPFFAEDDEEEEEGFEEVGELIEDGCVVEPGDDDDEEQEAEETEEAEESEESEDEDLSVDAAEEPSETGGGKESNSLRDDTQEGEDKIESDDETP
jgi:hypothetical protein